MKYNVVFLGRNISFLSLFLKNHRMNLVAANLCPDLLTRSSRNPVDWLFKQAYRLRFENRNRNFEETFNQWFQFLKPLASPLYRQYAAYLNQISSYRLLLLDLDEEEYNLDLFKQQQIDILVTDDRSFLSETLVRAPRYNTVRIHTSLLPKYAGALPVLWALRHGEKETGISLMMHDRSQGMGRILSQQRIPIDKYETALTLQDKCEWIIQHRLMDDLENYLRGRVAPRKPGQAKVSGSATIEKYAEIHWSIEKSKDVLNKILFYDRLWPTQPCYTYLGKRRICFRRGFIAKTSLVKKDQEPGSYAVSKKIIYIKTIDDVVGFRLFTGLGFVDSCLILILESNKLSQRLARWVERLGANEAATTSDYLKRISTSIPPKTITQRRKVSHISEEEESSIVWVSSDSRISIASAEKSEVASKEVGKIGGSDAVPVAVRVAAKI